MTTPFGLNYTVIGELESNTLSNPVIKTVWTISNENNIPLLSPLILFKKMKKIEEFDLVVLTKDFLNEGLKKGEMSHSRSIAA